MEKSMKSIEQKLNLIGTTASALSVFMYASLIEILISNIQGNSTIFIQPSLTCLNGLLWSTYGYLKKDWFIFVPNILGFILGLITALSVLF